MDIRQSGKQEVDIRISEYQVAGHQGMLDPPEADKYWMLMEQGFCGTAILAVFSLFTGWKPVPHEKDCLSNSKIKV